MQLIAIKKRDDLKPTTHLVVLLRNELERKSIDYVLKVDTAIFNFDNRSRRLLGNFVASGMYETVRNYP